MHNAWIRRSYKHTPRQPCFVSLTVNPRRFNTGLLVEEPAIRALEYKVAWRRGVRLVEARGQCY